MLNAGVAQKISIEKAQNSSISNFLKESQQKPLPKSKYFRDTEAP
jgi:hypothetical protein